MKPRYGFVTFDCYGTLVDWEAGIRDAFAAAAAAAGRDVDLDAVIEAHAEIEPIVQAAGYRTYREVLNETARRIGGRIGWEMTEADAAFLPESLVRWQPFPDTVSALGRMAEAGCRLGILSNIDDDLLACTLRRLEAPFELIVTAQELRSYKPAPAHFHAARERIGDLPWLHAAQSLFHDVAPCRRLGIPSAWINRKREASADVAPDHEFPDVTGLADWIGSH